MSGHPTSSTAAARGTALPPLSAFVRAERDRPARRTGALLVGLAVLVLAGLALWFLPSRALGPLERALQASGTEVSERTTGGDRAAGSRTAPGADIAEIPR